jgi:hypothetical protein
MRRHAGGVYYSLGLVDVTGTVRVIAFWRMAVRVMRKRRGCNGLGMDLAGGFDGGLVNFNLRAWQGLAHAKELINFYYGSEWRL